MMVEFVNEPVSVEVQVRKDGTVRPRAFAWRGHSYQVTSWGRESEETQQGAVVRCHLVQTADLDTWELCHDAETARWILARHWPRPQRAV